MKKIEYLSPEMEVVEIKVLGILCISGDGDGSTPDPSEDPTPIGGDL